jgi:GTPase SAR1 family protein
MGHEAMSDAAQSGLGCQSKLKAIFLGDSGAGKTSIYWQLLHPNTGVLTHGPTVGIMFSSYDFVRSSNNLCYQFQLYDTAGTERHRALATPFLRGAHMVIVVVDLERRVSGGAGSLTSQVTTIYEDIVGGPLGIICSTPIKYDDPDDPVFPVVLCLGNKIDKFGSDDRDRLETISGCLRHAVAEAKGIYFETTIHDDAAVVRAIHTGMSNVADRVATRLKLLGNEELYQQEKIVRLHVVKDSAGETTRRDPAETLECRC